MFCDTEVRELTGYDRVMAYRFHEDEHGEVVAEMRRRGSSSKIPLNINYDCERKGSLQREAERETVRRR